MGIVDHFLQIQAISSVVDFRRQQNQPHHWSAVNTCKHPECCFGMGDVEASGATSAAKTSEYVKGIPYLDSTNIEEGPPLESVPLNTMPQAPPGHELTL